MVRLLSRSGLNIEFVIVLQADPKSFDKGK